MKSYILAVAAVLSVCIALVASEQRERIPSEDCSLVKRLERVEKELATLRAAREKPVSHLQLTSPNGKRIVSIFATDDIAGLWVTGNSRREGCPAIYASHSEGAVIGLYGPDGLSKPMAFALSAKNPGAIQFEGKRGQLGFADLSSVK